MPDATGIGIWMSERFCGVSECSYDAVVAAFGEWMSGDDKLTPDGRDLDFGRFLALLSDRFGMRHGEGAPEDYGRVWWFGRCPARFREAHREWIKRR